MFYANLDFLVARASARSNRSDRLLINSFLRASNPREALTIVISTFDTDFLSLKIVSSTKRNSKEKF